MVALHYIPTGDRVSIALLLPVIESFRERWKGVAELTDDAVYADIKPQPNGWGFCE
jgi:hypothetical protein